MSNSNFVPDIEKHGWKFGYQKDIIVIIVNVHLFCTHQNLCVLEPLLLLFQFCNLGNGRDSLGSKTSDSVRHWWGSDVWVMWVDFQLVSDFLLDLPWQLSTTDGVKHIMSLQGSQTTIEFSLFMFNPAKKSFCRLVLMLAASKFHVRVKYQKIITMGWIIGQKHSPERYMIKCKKKTLRMEVSPPKTAFTDYQKG